jgi:hypothetical protein
MTKDKLLTMLRAPDVRKQLEEFYLLSISFSSEATRLAKELDENNFYYVLSLAKFKKLCVGPFQINKKHFWLDVSELPLGSGQSQPCFLVRISTVAEELEQREMIDDIAQWMGEGHIEIE